MRWRSTWTILRISLKFVNLSFNSSKKINPKWLDSLRQPKTNCHWSKTAKIVRSRTWIANLKTLQTNFQIKFRKRRKLSANSRPKGKTSTRRYARSTTRPTSTSRPNRASFTPRNQNRRTKSILLRSIVAQRRRPRKQWVATLLLHQPMPDCQFKMPTRHWMHSQSQISRKCPTKV